MSERTIPDVPNEEVDRIVASFEKIGWTCEVTDNEDGTSTIVATSPAGTTAAPFGPAEHMAAAADLAAQASAHAELAAVHLDRAPG